MGCLREPHSAACDFIGDPPGAYSLPGAGWPVLQSPPAVRASKFVKGSMSKKHKHRKRAVERAPEPPAVKPTRLVSDAALSAAAASGKAKSVVFDIPTHPPALMKAVPVGQRLAMDSNISISNSWANMALSSIWGEGLTFLGYPYLTELSQRPEYRVMSETLATEMTREFIEFTSVEEAPGGDPEPIGPITEALAAVKSKGQGDRLKELDAEFTRLAVKQLFAEATLHDGLFGRGHIYIDTGDTSDRDELQQSIGNGWDVISREKMKNGKILALRTVEPVWVYPTNYNSSNPLQDDWYRPNKWYVLSNVVHSSRLVTLIGREVPDLLKPTYSFGGISMTQLAKPYVDNWLSTRQSVNDIIQAFSVFVLKTSLAQQVQMGGDQLIKRAELFNSIRDNRGLMMIDKEGEDFQNVAASLAGLEGLQAQAQEHMASVSHIPVVKLLGIQPAGLNASSEGELRSFYDWILAFQEHLYRAPLKRIMGLIMVSLWGEVDDTIDFKFKPLWALDEKGKAEVRKTEADTDAVLVDLGAIDPAEVRKRVIDDPDSGYSGLDPDEVPEPPAPDPSEMPFGMPGAPPGMPGADPAADPTEGPAAQQQPDQLPMAVGQKQSGFAGDSVVVRGRPDLKLVLARDEAKFEEGKHPRGPDGKFTKGAAVASAIEKAGYTKATETKDYVASNKPGDHYLWQGKGEGDAKWIYNDPNGYSFSGEGSKSLKAVLAGDPDALKVAQAHYKSLNDINKIDWLGEASPTAESVLNDPEVMNVLGMIGGGKVTVDASGNASVVFAVGEVDVSPDGSWIISPDENEGWGKPITGIGAKKLSQSLYQIKNQAGSEEYIVDPDDDFEPEPDPHAAFGEAVGNAGFKQVKATGGDKGLMVNTKGQSLHVDFGTEKWTLASPGHQTKSGTGADALNALLSGDKPAFKAAGVVPHDPSNTSFPSAMNAPTAAKPAAPAKPAEPAYLQGKWGDPATMRQTIAKVRPPASAKQEAGIANYKGSGYTSMNAQMRFQQTLSSHGKEIHSWLEKASLPEDMTLWRGISGDYANQLMALVDAADESGIGSVFRDRGFMSCSTSKNFSDDWRKSQGPTGVLMRVEVKKGMKGASIRDQHTPDGEYEILMQDDHRLHVLGFDHATRTMHVEIVESAAAVMKAHAEKLGLAAAPAVTPAAAASKASEAVGEHKEPIDLDYMKKVGDKLGSNPGGVYRDKSGKKYYVKDSHTPAHATSELLAAKLYNLAGSPTLNYVPVEGGGKVATEWQDPSKKKVSEFSPEEKAQAQKNFATHAWLANWDAAGMGGDNQAVINGVPTTVDVGGSLAYRAQGALKDDFGDAAIEWDSLRSPSINPDNAALFGSMTPAQLQASAAQVTSVSDDAIRQAVADAGMPEAMASKLIARKADIGKRAAALAPKPVQAAPPVSVQVSSGAEGTASASAPKIPFAKQPTKYKVEVLAKSNPKKPGTKANEAFSKYKSGQTVKEFMDNFATKGEALSHLNWDFAKGFIKVVPNE